MSDVYSYPLLVELEENNFPKIQMKLLKYFNSKKSGGGDCEVDYERDSRTAVLRFRTEQDQKNVLGKESHQIQLGSAVLKMKVRFPPDEKTAAVPAPQEVPSDNVNKTSEVQAEAKGRDDVAAEETLCSTSAVLGNVPEDMGQELLEMLVENIIKGSKSPTALFTLEIIHGISSVVVTFESGKESTNFVARCPQNRIFTSKGLSVRPLELTKQVAVEDTLKLEKEYLNLYFENAGEDVESVLLNEGEQFIVTFKDSQAVQKVVKKKHHIQQEEFRVYPFYSSLGAALYGKDRPCLNLPAAISEPTDNAVWRYLNEHKSALETIHSDLAKNFCSVKHEGSAVILRPVPSILGQKDAKAIIKEWKSTVGLAFAQAMSKFKSLKFQPDSEVLEECVENIGQMLQNKDVTLVHDKARGVLSVVGFVDEVNKMEQSLRKTINKIEGRVQREKATKTDVIKVSPSIFQLLRQDGLLDKLQRLYPDLKMSFPEDSPDLIVTGLRDEILEADKVIREAKYSLKRMKLEMEKSVLDWLMLEEQDELTKAMLISDGISAAFEISEQRVELLAFSDRDLSKAEDHLRKLLMSQNIGVEDSSVLETPAWQDLVRQLQDANSKSCRRLQILCTGKQVVVSGHKSDVTRVSDELEYFLTQNAKVEESVDVKSNTIIEYIKKCKTSFMDQFKDKVTVSFRNEAICLNGSRVDVTHCKTLVENLVQSLSFESVNITKPGVKKFFQDKETMYVTSLLTDTGCLVQLVDETGGGQNDLAQSPGPKPVYQFQTSDGVEIAVCKADLCSYPVDAVVNSSNQQLQHNGGLGAALLNAAGPQLQVECDKIINLRGPLKPGDCVITDAGGRLRCKRIIHAFGPVFDPSAHNKSQAQLKRAVKGSLDLAERHGCITVALPTISRTQGFRLDLCALTIIKAVKEHCDEKYNDTTLKEIHLVNNDDAAVQAMERAVKSEFGNGGVTLQAASPRLTQARSTQSDPNCLGQVTTIEGLNITLTQGNIEDATTEVIVNTTSEDLELKKGAVSNAILLAAGPKLQQLINAQEARGSFGEVIVTDGCRLKSKKVYHAIAPQWGKGQGGTERILSAIFKDCLDKAEDTGLTSIALPAVGTGNLGFPRDLVASSMLSEISAFSMKKPKQLKEVVIVLYPGDAKTIQAFRDGFDKEFPSSSGGPAPTGSPQNTVQQGPFSNVISSTGMHETKMGGVTIQVVSGDITKETSEVIVNSSNDSFSLKSGVSKAILEAAGQAVIGECKLLGALPNQDMIMTSQGNLSCKKILHVIGQTDPGKIRAVVKSALEMCVKNGYASVSLPAIGTGQGNVQVRQVADAMFDAVIDVLSKNTHGSLKTIRIVIFQAPMLNEFQSSMQQRAQSAASKSSDKDGGWWKRFTSFLVGGTADKPRKEENFVIKPVACDPACFHICGDTQAKVASAKQWINNLITKDQSTNTIKDTAILSFSDADHQQIINIQKAVGVSIMIEGKKDQVELTIEGFDNGVLKATAEIYTMMKKVKDEEELKRYMDIVSKVADWQYQQQGLHYQSFDQKTNVHLEQAMQQKLKDVKVNIQGQDFTVNLPNGPATNKKGDALQIRRIDKLKDAGPAHWDAMPPNTTCVAVPIHAGTPEHTEVLNLFQASCKQTVIKIERIQNPMLWKSIQIKKRDIEQRNGHANNERRLFHGTTETLVNTINENGFNRVYAGKNAAYYGNGTYFAVRADYSAHDTYSKPNPKGEKCMYLCQVLTGEYALGQQGMIEPPVKSNKAPQLYDSVVDRMANPNMFIIFHDVQAYPEYLITFKNKTESNSSAAAEPVRTADMSDVYSYPLLVELEENNFPKIKIKLLKYFNSKKSGGGDCEVDYERDSRTAVLRFRTEQDQKNVLGKESHQIQLDTAVLKMTVRIPPDEKTAAVPAPQEVPSDNVNKTSEVQAETKGRDDVAAEETLCSTSAVLGNVPEEMSQEVLEMLVENIIKGSKFPSASFTLEIIHGISSVVVTLESGKEITDFVARCPQNRMFTSKGLSVRPLEVTKQVAIEDTQKFDKDFLHLYFENAGEDVESVLLNEGEQFIVTFKDSQAAQKVVKEKQHSKQEEFRVYPFYSSLGAALYGKDRPCLKLPAAISEPTDDAVWRYLNDHKSALETIHSDLAKHFCSVKHEGSAVILRPVPSILGQKDAKAIIKEWKSTVGLAFAQAMSKFKSLKFQLDSEVLEECVENIGHMLQNKDVTLVHDKASGVLSVVGFVDEVNELEQSLRKTINKIEGKVQREKATKTDVIKVSPSIFHLLCQGGLQDKLQRIYPELKMSFPEDSPDLIVTGLRDEILEADKVICEAKYSLKRMNLEMDKSVLDLLRFEEQDELTKALLTTDGVNAAFEISEQRVELLGLSDRDLSKAEDHLKKLLMSQNIGVEDSSVLETPAWQDLVRQLQDANSKSCRRLQVLCTGKQVVVSGHKGDVMNVSDDLEYFLTQNAKVEESVDVKPNNIIEYIKKCKTSFMDQFKDKVTVSFRNEAICLNGSRVDVTHCKTLVENLVQSLSFESVNITKPGVKKFFQDKETMYVTSLLTDTGCLVQLVDETGGGQNDLAQSPGPKPVYQLQTSDGVEIAVCKADLCSYPVDAVVNSSNQKLQHSGGLGAALLNAAGPQLQVECDKIINQRGPLKPGDCVITDAGGRLRCKKIIHAVGPVFDPSAPKKSQAQLKRAVKGSLDLAERHGCITVALPTISRTQGFGLDLCALTIIKAVKEHCDEKYDENTLKEIHLVNNDDAAVQAMERAVKSELGNGGVTLQAASPLLTQARSTQSDPNCLGQVTTIESLNITLTQGNIEDATTEVIVNTVSEDLELNKGAVSNAILLAAGPELQQLINAQKARGSFGEVIVTDGCRLKSKKVFHAIAPYWEKGQGGTERILSAIFKDCLDKAEDTGLTSIALPAVGTGNLHFPRDLVASLMLSEISAFTMKKPKHLKEVVIVLYPGDAKTIQAFKDGFDKEFPSASGGPAPTGSPQNTVQQCPFSNVISSSGMHETKMGGVTIQVLTGVITMETSEVIVNSSNDSFSLKSGVSKAILEAAGQAVEGECQRLGALPNQDMIMTDPGNLSCKKILHVIEQDDPGKIRAVVKSALEMCVKNAYDSVSLPAIGAGQGNVQARQVADAMFDAVIDVLSPNTHGSLKTIRIVIFQAPMLNEFQISMQHRAQSAASKPSDKDSGWWKRFKSFFVGGTDDKPRKEENFVIKPVACDPACFHICGDTQAKVATAKQWINDLITKDQSTNTLKDTAILSFSDADHQQIINIQKTVGVSIMIEGKKDQVELTIEGFSNGVLRATAEIYTMTKKVKEDDDLMRDVVMASKVADWQYQQQGLQYQSFDPYTNFHLEQAMQKKLKDVKVNVQGQDYTVTLPNGPATNKKGDALQIRRIDKLGDKVPADWDPMPPNTTCVAVPIHEERPEYNEVLKLFQASCKQTVIKIERIQNPMLWKSIQIKKRDIEQRNGHANNEKRLFHGTTETTVNIINQNGFNRVYAGKNAAAFGNGTYFAVNANYSAQDTYSKPNPKGEKCMYLCQVLTGDYALGQQGMIEPPVKSNKAPQLYDSVVDNMANPNMFIIFHDVQAYPEYLITFQ
ncbi:uncharacterized protein LOC133022028 [Limanda limanda]|uniref:uncharacterized protein LOC133022028 n=1 Tax=Limanda limanda TaxID=27771 RepID=UPI0029C8B27D|nr:uncharacterized protein LOC133022028 [Limanda limanda]